MDSTRGRGSSTDASGPARPLVVTSDADVLDDLLRLAAAAGVAVDAAPDAVAARAFWAAAPLIVVGDDVARSATGAARAGLRRRGGRGGVVLVTRDVDDAGVWSRAADFGADHVCVLPDGEPWLVGMLADVTEPPAPPARLVAVVGGRGGAGASSLAAALAVTAARAGQRVTFVDADPLGGGADLLFGGESAAGARWSDLAPDLAMAQGRIPAHALREALPCVAELAVLSWDRPRPDPGAVGVGAVGSGAADFGAVGFEVAADLMASVLDAAARASDLVVVDLPRRFDEAAHAVLAAADLVLLISPAEVRAAAATARVAAEVRPHAADARLVVRGPAPGGLRASEVATAVGLPLAGELAPEPDLDGCLERGEAPAGRGTGPLARLCARLLAELTSDRAAAADARRPA
jgi:secretion/DNA translocation related CpaE-like protein